MKKVFAFLIVLSLVLFSGCEKKPPEIVVSSEPCMIEATTTPFSKDIIEPYVSIVDGDGKKLDFSDLEITGTVNSAVVGVYNLDLKYTYKNQVAESSISVHVVDTALPQITVVDKEILLMVDSVLDLSPELYGIHAYDSYDGLITNRITYTDNVDVATPGTYQVQYTVSDTSGNATSLSVNVRVTKSIDEYAKYLYERAIKLYWGEYFQLNTAKEAPYNKQILNYEAVLKSLFSETMIQTFERINGVNGNVNSEKSPVSISVDNENFFLGVSEYERRLDYTGSKLEMVQKRETYIKYNVISSYGANKDSILTETTSFSIRYEDGRWVIEEFVLPN